MTAVNPMQPNAPPVRDQRGYEPSMEEILASIRRIIADDQSMPGRALASQDAPILAEQPSAPKGPSLSDVHVLRPIDDAAAHATTPDQVAEHPADTTAIVVNEAEAAAEPPSFAAHGTIAPQFATPEGPVASQDPHLQEQPAATAIDRSTIDTSGGPGGDAAPKPSASQATDHAADLYNKPLGRHEPIPFEPATLISPSTDQALVAAFNMLAASRLTENTEDLLAMTREMIRPLLKTWLDDNLPSMVERLVRAEIERAARGAR